MPDQEGGDIFVAEITQVGIPLAESGSGFGSYYPHGWKEKMVRPQGRSYIDNPIGRTGTSAINPAFDLNGNIINVGTLCFMRLRGWNEWHQQYIYDILGFLKTGSNSDNCNVYMKMLVDVCGTAFPLKKIYSIVRLCDGAIMSTFCESVVDCGSPCPASCDCEAVPCMTFDVSGIVTNCTSVYEVVDCTLLNKTWCLTRSALGNGYEAGDPAGFAVLWILADCTAFLKIGRNTPPDCGCGEPSGCVAEATYQCLSFSCSTGGTFGIIGESVTGCGSFPTEISVSPSYCCVESGGGGSHDCTDCAATTWKVTISGTTNGTCTVCSAVDVTDLVLTNIATCQWQAFVGNITCSGFGTAISATLIDNGSTGWELTLSGLATYFLSYASWSCTAANTMNKVSGGAQCNWPATITVQKNS